MDHKRGTEQLPSQRGRVAIITGANGGLGYETALGLARQDMQVILACRDLQKAEAAKSKIVNECPNAQVKSMKLDVSRLRDVKEFAIQFRTQYAKLDLLINNAGIMMSPYEVTEDGFENQFATNYLGHFALTGSLLPTLANTPGSRIVTLSSLSYKWAEIQFDDFHAEKSYSRRKAYGQSKRACLMFAYELQRRLAMTRQATLSVAAHPGLSKTNLDQHFPKLIRPLGSLFLQSAERGALPVLYAALSEQIKGGEYIGPDGFQEMRGNPIRVDSDEYSKDKDVAGRLWSASEEMTNTHYLSDVR